MSISKRYLPWGLFLMSVSTVVFVSGCRYGSHSDGNDARVRLINAVPDAGGLDVSVDGKRVWKRSQFRSSTGYQGIASGNYPMRLESSEFGATLLTGSLAFEKGHTYTVLALGAVRNGTKPAAVQVFEDERKPSGKNEKALIRLVNAAPGLEPIDLVVNNIVGLKAVAYGKHSKPLALDGGSYDLKIVAADTPAALIGPVSLKLEPGRAYTLVAMGQVSNQTLTLESYPDAR